LRICVVAMRALVTGSNAMCSPGWRCWPRQRAQDWITVSDTKPEGRTPSLK
jgi:hypothetical protein